MPASCTVTPGATVTDTTNLTAAILNQLANPQVSVPDGVIDGPALDVASVQEALGDGASGTNYFLNPNFSMVKWTRGTTPVTCPIATQTYRADDWWCNPAGAGVTYERVQAGPNSLSLHSALLTGAASVTTVDFGQDIPAHLASGLCTTVTVSVWIYNATGASLAPTLKIDTANVLGVFTAVTERVLTASSSPQATASWQKHTWTAALASYPDCANGLRVAVRFPSGSLNTGAKSVRIAQAKIELGTVASQFVVPIEEEASTEAAEETTTATTAEFLRNPDFRADRWRTTSAITLANGSRVYGAENWWANAAGSGNTARMQRDTTVPSTLSLHSVKLTGGAGTNEVDFGQEIPSHVAAAMRRSMAISIYFYNGTGAAIAPSFRLDTYDAADNPAAATNRVNETLESCADGAWTRIEHTFDGSLLTNLSNGCRLYFRVPSASMDSTGELVRFAQASLTPGLAAIDFAPPGPQPPAASVNGTAAGLVIAWASVSTLTVAAEEIILKDDAGDAIRVVNLSATVNIATASAVNGTDGFTEAADAWYYIWAISNGTTAGGLLSESASSPTLPAGYRYKALIGFVRNTSNDFVRFKQTGKVYVRTPVAAIASISSAPETFTLTNFIPPQVARISGFWATTANVNLAVKMYSDTSMLDAHYFMAIASGIGALDTYRTAIPFDVPITAPPALIVNAPTAPTTDFTLAITGYTLK